MNTTPKVVLGVLGVIGGAVAIRTLSDATLSTHQPMAAGSRIDLVVDARAKDPERGQTLRETVEAQVLTCRLEVGSDVVGDIDELGDDRYHVVLTPDMDQTNRRQFRGCLEDWIIDHVLLDVVHLDTALSDDTPPRAG